MGRKVTFEGKVLTYLRSGGGRSDNTMSAAIGFELLQLVIQIVLRFKQGRH